MEIQRLRPSFSLCQRRRIEAHPRHSKRHHPELYTKFRVYGCDDTFRRCCCLCTSSVVFSSPLKLHEAITACVVLTETEFVATYGLVSVALRGQGVL